METFQEIAQTALNEYTDSLLLRGMVYPDDGNSTVMNALALLCNAESHSKSFNRQCIEDIRKWEREHIIHYRDIEAYTMTFWYCVAMLYASLDESLKTDTSPNNNPMI